MASSSRSNDFDVLRYFFTETDYINDRLIYICKTCLLKYTHRNVTKMKKHVLTKCPGNPDTTNYGIGDIGIVQIEQVCEAEVGAEVEGTSSGTSSVSTSTRSKKRKTMNQFVDSSTQSEQNLLEEKLAFAIFTSKCPLSIVECPIWLEFFAQLKPTFQVPSKKILCTKLLDKCYEAMKEKVDTYIRESCGFVSIQVDGRTDLLSRRVFNFIINTPKPVFLDFLETKAEHNTAEYIVDQVKAVIQKYCSRPAHQFAGIITDNAAAMEAASASLLQDFPALIVTTCFAQSLNQFVGDIFKLPPIAEVLENVAVITSTVRQSSIIKAHFTKICDSKNIHVSLVLPCIKRWSSTCRSMQNMISLQTCLQLLANESEELKSVDEKREKKGRKKVTSTILDDQFWQKLKKILDLIEPLVDLIMTIPTDVPNIHTIYPTFTQIEDRFLQNVFVDLLSPTERSLILQKFQERKEQFVKPLYWGAYLLDPNCDRTSLQLEQELEVSEFINDVCEKLGMSDEDIGEILANMIHYKNKSGIFSKTILWKIKDKVQPILWWENVPSKLSAVAIRILSVPAACALTGSFSHVQDDQKKKRNKLKFERIRKLTFISRNNDIISSGFTSSTQNIMSTSSTASPYSAPASSSLADLAAMVMSAEEHEILYFDDDEPKEYSRDTNLSGGEELDVSEIEYRDMGDL